MITWRGGWGVVLTALLMACGSSVANSSDDGGGGDGAAVPGITLVGALGVQLTKVSFNQGVERVLMLGGIAQPSNVPLVTDRGGLLRVFYSAPNLAGTQVTGRLTYGDGSFVEQQFALYNESSDGDVNSTMNFDIPAERMNGSFAYGVSILGPGEAGTGNPGALFPQTDGLDVHAVQGTRSVMRVKLVPYIYNADGSGRVPDTSPQTVENYRNELKKLYPVSDVVVTVREPRSWSLTVGAYGEGWQEVMQDLYGLRQLEGTPDEYFYGLVNPANSFPQFCGQGCLLGLNYLNADPPNTGVPELRFAMGLGYPEMAGGTMAHELGHAHGRLHADCGPGLDPQSIDYNFPYPGGMIGTWGWDIIDKRLVNPAVASDLMGYCNNEWISDYNYIALFNRSQLVNLAKVSGDLSQRYDIVAVADDGVSYVGEVTQRRIARSDVRVDVTEGKASTHSVDATFIPYDHMSGGWLFVPRHGATSSIDLTLDGKPIHVDVTP